ncbi:MAG TPA: hypothetical protein VK645_01770 [Chitinophagaceae bacterium]|nr:hypothetical protein [Chitinophagaceae bacterium]
MPAFIEISINIIVLAAIILVSASVGFLINSARIKKHQSAIFKLEAEMLQNHAEILHLQKELSDKENLQSKTPIFSIADNASESLKEQVAASRLSKKISGGGKSTS